MNLFLGVDTAMMNNGVSILCAPEENDSLIYIPRTENVHTPKDGVHDVSDITKATFQKNTILNRLKRFKLSAACLESPAYSYMGTKQISIGIIHGMLTNAVNVNKLPWAWIAPTQWKFALMGKGKHDKKEHIKFVLSHFNINEDYLNRKKEIDDNQADSICLAYMAYVFYQIWQNEPYFYWGDEELHKRLEHVFMRKKEGIMHHPNSRIFNTVKL